MYQSRFFPFSVFLLVFVGLSTSAATDEEIAQQVAQLEIMVERSDLNDDGFLAGDEFGVMGSLMQEDPMIRTGMNTRARVNAATRTIDDVLQYDLDGDGTVSITDLPPRLTSTLTPWDFDSTGILEAEELTQLDGLLRFQAFTSGIGGNSQGIAGAMPALESLQLDGASRNAIFAAMEAESTRISTFQREVHETFMASVRGFLGAEDYEIFLDGLAEHLIQRPAALNPNASAGTQRDFSNLARRRDADGDGRVSRAELQGLMEDMARARIENAPEDIGYWQRNQAWLDWDKDRQLRLEEIPFLGDQLFSRFDLDRDDLIDPEEFNAMRDDRLQQYLRREIPLYRYGYPTMLPVLQSLNMVTDTNLDKWNLLLVEHERRFSAARAESRAILVEQMERILGGEGYEEFRQGFGIQ